MMAGLIGWLRQGRLPRVFTLARRARARNDKRAVRGYDMNMPLYERLLKEVQ